MSSKCQHFRDHYVEFAQQVKEYTDDAGAEEIKFYAVSCTTNKVLCRMMNVKGYPQVKLFAAGATNVTATVPYFNLHPFEIISTLGVELKNVENLNGDHTASTHHKKTIKKAKTQRGGFPVRTKQEVFDDAYLSFDFMLRNGIYMSNDPLDEKKTEAFRMWLELLKRMSPPTWHIQQTIRAVLDDFDRACKSEEDLLSILEPYPPRTKTWSESCTKGKAGMGYTCGLWQLFHIASIGLVEWNTMLNEGQDSLVVETDLAAGMR